MAEQLNSLDELIKNYKSTELLPNEVALFSEAQVLLSLVANGFYKGETHYVKQTLGRNECTVHRTSFAAAVLRSMKKLLDELDIEY